MDWQKELELAKRAARAAGERLRDTIDLEQEVLSAEGRDIKLQIDRDVERLILDMLAPSDRPVLAEESGEHGAVESGTLFWVVDPLDGTMNYYRGFPMCGVSIGLAKGDDPLLGVIYDFQHGELFSGVVGEGAWLNEVPVRVSGIDDASQSILATGFPAHFDFDDISFKRFHEETRRFKKVRMLGSAALALAYVACGRIDAYMEENVMLWDIAAGVAIARAAGGTASVAPTGKKRWAQRVRASSTHGIWGA